MEHGKEEKRKQGGGDTEMGCSKKTSLIRFYLHQSLSIRALFPSPQPPPVPALSSTQQALYICSQNEGLLKYHLKCLKRQHL